MYIPWWALVLVIVGAIMLSSKIEKLEDRVQDLEDMLDDKSTGFESPDFDLDELEK